MAKYYGKIGYVESKETKPGVWTNLVTERKYAGDVLRNSRRWESAQQVNDNFNVSNQISILADEFAYTNFNAIRYAEFMGAMWNVNSADIQHPRIILTLGGVYNGEQA